MAASLADILAQARSGALDQAWASFFASGFGDARDNPAALTLKGRLLKDRARRHEGAARVRLYAEAGAAYAAAAALRPATYPLINAASLALLAGDPARARALAEEVLALIASGQDEAETPYWLAATRAEALLLIGRPEAAEAVLAEAVAQAPEAWEDHAATLRQFAAICEAQGASADWLAAFRPPASVHFSGMMGLAPDDRETLGRLDEVIEREQPGFAFGALAAGGDIVIAERLQAEGARLHVVLPCPVAAFVETSVAAFGREWVPRFDALLADAARVECLGSGETLLPAAIRLADESAMGLALLHARRLESRAFSLRVEDRVRRRARMDPWLEAGQPLVRITADRVTGPVRGRVRTSGDIAAVLAIAGALAPCRVASGTPARWRVLVDGSTVHAFDSPALALQAARGLRMGRDDIRMGLDYALVDRDAATALALAGATALAAAAAPGRLLASRSAALALAVHAPDSESEMCGELRTASGVIEVASIPLEEPDFSRSDSPAAG